MKSLFSGNDPALKMRDSHGRYATPERAYADKAIRELAYLKLETEKYKRMYESVVKVLNIKNRERYELNKKEYVKRLSKES